jgi:hypothetical protein
VITNKARPKGADFGVSPVIFFNELPAGIVGSCNSDVLILNKGVYKIRSTQDRVYIRCFLHKSKT